MVKICLLLIKNTSNINLHHINYCFKIALSLFTHSDLVYVNIDIDIFLFLNVVLSQNLVFAPGASILMNTVIDLLDYVKIQYRQGRNSKCNN